jgi:type VI protein secretion system component Hcp
MNKKKRMNKIATCIALFVFLAAGNIASAQTQNIYIKATDQSGRAIPGEVQAKGYTGDIGATSFGQDNSACALTGGAGGCKPTLGHFVFNMTIDKSLVTMNQLLFTGSPMKTIDFIFVRNTGATSTPVEFYRVHLELASIVHITNAIDVSGAPTAQVELAAVRSGWTYTPISPTGAPGTPVKFGWDSNGNVQWNSF